MPKSPIVNVHLNYVSKPPVCRFELAYFILSPPCRYWSITYECTRRALFDFSGNWAENSKIGPNESAKQINGGEVCGGNCVFLLFFFRLPLLEFCTATLKKKIKHYCTAKWIRLICLRHIQVETVSDICMHRRLWRCLSRPLTFHPAWWLCNRRTGCWWNWCWLRPAVFRLKSQLVRGWRRHGCTQKTNTVTMHCTFTHGYKETQYKKDTWHLNLLWKKNVGLGLIRFHFTLVVFFLLSAYLRYAK